MRQESNHRMNSGDKESPRISNSRAMGVIILIVLLFVFQVTAFVVQKVRIAALERDAVAVESEAAVPVRAAAAESGADDTMSGLDSRSGALPKYGKRARASSSSGLGKKAMAERFPFDPNDISLDSLQLLGFSRKQAQTILNYRNKGGKFRQKKDFAKMYVVDSAMYTSLAPYILLPDRYPVKSAVEGNLVPKRAIYGTKLAESENLVPKRAISGTKPVESENLVPKTGDFGTKLADDVDLVPKTAISGTKPVESENLVPKSGDSGTKLADDVDLVPKRAIYGTKPVESENLVPKSGDFGTKLADDVDLVPKRAISGTKLTDDENLVPKSGDSGTKPVEEEVFGQKVERNRYMCNLNTADSAALVRLYGIGGYYARKILQYRERLGGSFVSPRQLLEIDGFTQERYSKIEKSIFVREEDIKGFSILNADRADLERHPYIGPYAARGIVTYLRVKGVVAKTVNAAEAATGIVAETSAAGVNAACREEIEVVVANRNKELSILKELVKERILTPENARKLEEYLLYL